MRPFIVGTAGHVDHGKSALVKALTGTDPDRLPEEKRRGITIELGFASAELAPGASASFVDVPGHERFVRAMVAGAHGVDVVLLAVALDEGVMPQTREHADICRLLGLTRAVVALTKDDLSDLPGTGWADLVADDVRSLGPPFATARVVRTSARTGAGLDALRQALVETARDLPAKPTAVPAFLPIDRVFTLRGHGTVVTGTLVAGRLEAGSAIELVAPSPRHVAVAESLRARTVQVHGHAVEAHAGQRTAVNVPGVEVAQVARGAALVAAGTGEARSGSILDAQLESVPDAPPLRHRARLTLHLGTAHALGTVDLLGSGTLAPGARGLAQLRLDRALPALRDQRFVLRGFRALARGGHTVAGGRVLLAGDRRRRASDRPFLEALAGPGDAPLRALVRDAGAAGADAALLRLRLNLPDLPKNPAVERLGGRWFDPAVLDALLPRLREVIASQPGVSREAARAALGTAVAPEAFARVLARLGPGFTVGETLSLDAAPPDPCEEAIASALSESKLTPPTSGELTARLRADPAKVTGALRALAKKGRAVRLTEELYADAAAAADFRRRVVDALRRNGSLTTQDLKDLAGTSRKFAIPLCEWLDRERVTLRVGDRRTLRGG